MVEANIYKVIEHLVHAVWNTFRRFDRQRIPICEQARYNQLPFRRYKLLITIAYFPPSNGQDKRFKCTVVEGLRYYESENQRDIDKYVQPTTYDSHIQTYPVKRTSQINISMPIKPLSAATFSRSAGTESDIPIHTQCRHKPRSRWIV